jgi:hypothetical protein
LAILSPPLLNIRKVCLKIHCNFNLLESSTFYIGFLPFYLKYLESSSYSFHNIFNDQDKDACHWVANRVGTTFTTLYTIV